MTVGGLQVVRVVRGQHRRAVLLVVGWQGTCNIMYVRKLDRFEDVHYVQIKSARKLWVCVWKVGLNFFVIVVRQ